jgi:hypothetical protein
MVTKYSPGAVVTPAIFNSEGVNDRNSESTDVISKVRMPQSALSVEGHKLKETNLDVLSSSEL